MPDIAGKEVLLYIEDPGTPGTFLLIAAGTSHTLTINNTEVDKNSKDSGGFREIFPEGSIKSVTISGSWIFQETADHDAVRDVAMSTSNPAATFRFNLGGTRRITGEFQVSSYEHNGDTEGFAGFSCQLASNGVITEEAVA